MYIQEIMTTDRTESISIQFLGPRHRKIISYIRSEMIQGFGCVFPSVRFYCVTAPRWFVCSGLII